jgi:hypothetical protein
MRNVLGVFNAGYYLLSLLACVPSECMGIYIVQFDVAQVHQFVLGVQCDPIHYQRR